MANDTINNMMMYSDHEGALSDFQPLNGYIEENKEGVRNDFFLLKPVESPKEERSEQVSEIIYILHNGNRFEAVTDPIMLRK